MTTDRYEDRLLAALRALAAENAPAPARAARGRRPRRLALAAAAAAACATTAALALPGGDQAAYAVEPHDDGSVTIEISALRDAAGLERTLREHGIAAEVDYLPPGQVCRSPRYTPTDRAPAGDLRPRSDGAYGITVTKDDLAPGETLVITSTTPDAPGLSGMEGAAVSWGIAQGEVAPCEPVPGSLLRRVGE